MQRQHEAAEHSQHAALCAGRRVQRAVHLSVTTHHTGGLGIPCPRLRAWRNGSRARYGGVPISRRRHDVVRSAGEVPFPAFVPFRQMETDRRRHEDGTQNIASDGAGTGGALRSTDCQHPHCSAAGNSRHSSKLVRHYSGITVLHAGVWHTERGDDAGRTEQRSEAP